MKFKIKGTPFVITDRVLLYGLILAYVPVIVYLRIWSMYEGRLRFDYSPADPIIPILPFTSARIALLLAIGIGAVIFLEWRYATISTLFSESFKTPGRIALLLLVVYGVAASNILLPGGPAARDAVANTEDVWVSYLALRSGQTYSWTNFSGFGLPHTQFSPGFKFLLPAGLMFIIGEHPHTAFKLSIFAYHVLSGWVMYEWVRRWRGSRWAGAIAGLAWVLALYLFKIDVLVGRYHNAPLTLLLPLTFLGLELLISGEDGAALRTAFPAMVCHLAIRTHITYGTLGGLLIYGFTLIRILIHRQYASQRTKLLLRWGISALLGVGLSLSVIVPAVVERGYVGGVSGVLQATHFGSVVSLRGILSPRWSMASGDPDQVFIGYAGLSTLLLAGLAIVLTILKRLPDVMWSILLLVAGFVLTFGPNHPLFDRAIALIPFGSYIYAGKSSGFYFIYALIPLCALAGISIEALSTWLDAQKVRFRIALLGLCFGAAISLDLLPPGFQSYGYAYQFPAAFRAPAFSWVAAQAKDDSRMAVEGNYGPAMEMTLTGHPGLVTNFEQIPVGIDRWLRPADSLLWSEVRSGSLSDSGRNLVYLMDLGYIVYRPTVDFTGMQTLSFGEDNAVVIVVDEHSPLLATLHPVRVTVDEPPLRFLEEIHIDPSRNAADWWPILDAEPSGINSNDGSNPLAVHLDAYQVTGQQIQMTFTLNRAAFVQVSWAYYPYQEVRLDGELITPSQSAFGMVGFAAAEGTHDLTITARLSPLRKNLNLLTGVILAGIVFWGGLDEWRKHQRQRMGHS